MDRRSFLNFSLSTALIGAVPVKALATVKPAIDTRYAWAVAMAKSQNRVSVDLLKSSLKVGEIEAKRLMTRLSSRGVITAVDSTGVARAVTPIFKAGSSMPAVSISTASGKTDLSIKKALHIEAKGLGEPSETEIEQEQSLISEDDACVLPEDADAERSAG